MVTHTCILQANGENFGSVTDSSDILLWFSCLPDEYEDSTINVKLKQHYYSDENSSINVKTQKLILNV
jgi:hypothetical protein